MEHESGKVMANNMKCGKCRLSDSRVNITWQQKVQVTQTYGGVVNLKTTTVSSLSGQKIKGFEIGKKNKQTNDNC